MKHKLWLYVLVFALLLVLATMGYFTLHWLNTPIAAQQSEQISDQTNKRLKDMAERGSIVNTVHSESNSAGTQLSASCFNISAPFSYGIVRPTDRENGCSLYVELTQPKGTLVVTLEKKPGLLSLTEVPSVALRMKEDSYKSVNITSPYKQTLSFTNQSELTSFVLQSPVFISVSFSNLGRVDQSIFDAAEKTLESIEVK